MKKNHEKLLFYQKKIIIKEIYRTGVIYFFQKSAIRNFQDISKLLKLGRDSKTW